VGRNKKFPLLEKIRITDIGAEGKALARIDNLVVFVPMLIPGDIVDIRIIKKKRKYLEGIAVKFHEYSADRIRPVCVHFGTCGGCKWQHIPYRLQLGFKEKQVKDNLLRIGKLELPEITPILGSMDEYFYRNKLEYTFSSKRWLTHEEITSGLLIEKENAVGFHIPGLFDKVLNITKCHLQPEPTNAIRNVVREYSNQKRLSYFDFEEQKGFLRNLIIRNSSDGGVMVIVVFHHEDERERKGLLDFIYHEFPQISSLMYVINSKRNDSLSDQSAILYKGDDHLIEMIGGLKFRIGPKSFYQTNTKQAANLYRVVKEYAGLTGKEIVYDLYTGTGTIANFVAGSARKVIGIEYIEEAVKDAEINSELNGFQNTFFFTGDIKNLLTDQFFSENGRPDVIITDPPRAGMHEDVINSIMNASPRIMVYVSCNPATQARDLHLLSGQYKVKAVQPVDMFPHTHHIENVVLLEKKGGPSTPSIIANK
jgi:23S rRNA (uracil1939-C5)-methyltransferase